MRATPEEIKQMIDLFNSLPDDVSDKYGEVSKQLNKPKGTVYGIIRRSKKKDPDVKYFNPRERQF